MYFDRFANTFLLFANTYDRLFGHKICLLTLLIAMLTLMIHLLTLMIVMFSHKILLLILMIIMFPPKIALQTN